MALTREEQSQTRLLAIVLPILTLSTHTLLALSFALPGSEQDYAFWSLSYNVLAAGASVLGLIGAVKSIPSFVSAYTLTHTATLSFVTIALVEFIVPFDTDLFNPVVSKWHVDESAMCRDIGWDDDWLVKCSENIYTVMLVVAIGGLLFILAQWGALWAVRQWCKELRFQKLRNRMDVEKMGLLGGSQDFTIDEKTRE